jgi:hypothetical protein
MWHAYATIKEEEPVHISSYQTLPGTNNSRISKPRMKRITNLTPIKVRAGTKNSYPVDIVRYE